MFQFKSLLTKQRGLIMLEIGSIVLVKSVNNEEIEGKIVKFNENTVIVNDKVKNYLVTNDELLFRGYNFNGRHNHKTFNKTVL